MRTTARRNALLYLILGALLLVSLRAFAQQDAAARGDTPTISLAEAAQAAYDSTMSAFIAGTTDVEKVYSWSIRWMDAEDTPAARQSHLARMQELHRSIVAKHQHGAAGGEVEIYHATMYYVVEAKGIVSRP